MQLIGTIIAYGLIRFLYPDSPPPMAPEQHDQASTAPSMSTEHTIKWSSPMHSPSLGAPPPEPQHLAKLEGTLEDGTPAVLFLCVHNAGRSQMAAGWLRHLAGDRVVVWSGGSEPAAEINPAAIAAMAEVGIDITEDFPKPWTDEVVRAADVVITMGCGDACPVYPGKRYEDWELPDPAGHDLSAVRPIRDQIRVRVEQLLHSLRPR
jgi:protein-tyrosine-phosphatase